MNTQGKTVPPKPKGGCRVTRKYEGTLSARDWIVKLIETHRNGG